MLFTAHSVSYRATATFSPIVLDYIENAKALQPFYATPPTEAGMLQAVEAKRKQPFDRATLVHVLKEHYNCVEANDSVSANIDALLHEHTFTVCTAHQPNLFAGPLYFVYKILHAIRLADALNQKFSQYHFVPVYYMGSEDADKEELLHTYIGAKKYEWQTAQTGAVGRMLIDAALIRLIDDMAGQLRTAPYGNEVVDLFYRFYKEGTNIQTATFGLVHALFKKFGLVVLIPDHGLLKKMMQPVFEEDVFLQMPSEIVEKTVENLSAYYNIQANPRAVNLFYLVEGIRNRIIKQGDGYWVNDTNLRFTEAALKTELQQHPERFSPNVILRGLFQETILPNVAFIGGGGELAYWLQLQDLFRHYQVPFPVLVLRNSFLIVEKKWQERIEKWPLPNEKLFQPDLQIINSILEQQGRLPQLNGEVVQLSAVYEDLKKLAGDVDVTLLKHVDALKTKSLQQLRNLEKKMARAERKKHEALKHQVMQLKEALFPKSGLQERVENFSSFYAKWGSSFIDALLDRSLTLEQQFTVLTEA